MSRLVSVKRIADGLHLLPGLVNMYLLDTDDGLALIDTGFPGSTKKVMSAVTALGRTPADIRHIVLTHCHPDHIGSAAAVQRATGATVWAHPIDAPMIEAGETMRQPMTPSPGLRNRILASLLSGRVRNVEPVKVDHLLEDGDHLPFLPDVSVIHVPGHCAGQIALLWQRHGGVMFSADACINRRGLRLAIATEDRAVALASLARLATFAFDKLCVMHGPPILSGADAEFRKTAFAGSNPIGKE